MPLYSMLPAVTEFMAEAGWTLAYPRVANVGWPAYLLYFALYMSCVEFCVYWVHRGLHDLKWGYRYALPSYLYVLPGYCLATAYTAWLQCVLPGRQ